MIKQLERNKTMKKIVRLSEQELIKVMRESVTRALREKNLVNEAIDYEREIRLAQKELYQMSSNLSSIGLRLNGSIYQGLYEQMKNSIVALNDALIKHIRGGK